MSTPIQPVMWFADYTFSVMSNGDIYMDEELDPKALNVKTGDKFEAIIVPTVGLVLRKLPAITNSE